MSSVRIGYDYSAGNMAYSGSVWQTRTVWVRNWSHTFLDRIVAEWDEAEWTRNFRIGRPKFHFLCTAFSNSAVIFL